MSRLRPRSPAPALAALLLLALVPGSSIAPGDPPVAVLGAPPTATAGEAFLLDGSGSTSAGNITTYRFSLDGIDQPDQAEPTLSVTLTVAGPHTAGLVVLDDLDGVSEPVSVAITIGAGPLASFDVSPSSATLGAGSTQAFAAAGADAFGNSVPVSPAWSADCGSIDGAGLYTAPTLAGLACEVAADEGAFSDTASVSVVAGPLASIVVTPTGLSLYVHQAPVQLAAAGFDAFGNSVAISPTWTATRGSVDATGLYSPTQPGSALVNATVGSVRGTATASVTDLLLVTVALDQATYAADDALLNGVGGLVTSRFADGTPAAGAWVRVTLRQVVNGEVRHTTLAGATSDANGELRFEAPLAYRLPGNYEAEASAFRLSNHATVSAPYAVVA
jgi:hypothetical protein